MRDDVIAALTPDFKSLIVFRAVNEREDGSVGYSTQKVYRKIGPARSNVHSYAHYATGKSTAHIVIYSCHPDTGEWQIENMFEQGYDLRLPLPWQKGYKP